MKIVLSAGHNPGTDSGAVGQGQLEVNENIRIVDRIAQYFTAWGIDHVVMPHTIGNLSAEQKWVNDRYPYGTAYAIQVHRNAFNGTATGNEVWTANVGQQMALAKSILDSMTAMTGLKSRGVKDIIASNWPLGWITGVNCESVLIEARFIDHDSITDADDYLDAYAIAVGVAKFLKVPYGKSLEAQAEEARALAEAQAKAKAEADRLANLARIEAEKQAEIARIAEIARLEAIEAAKKAEADRLAAEKAAAEAEKLAHASDHLFIERVKALITIIIDFFTKLKG